LTKECYHIGGARPHKVGSGPQAWKLTPMKKAKRFERIEAVLIMVALVSLWPIVLGYHALWYRTWLVAVLGFMVWVTVRRMGRIRAGADEAKRKRDEQERGGRPPFLG